MAHQQIRMQMLPKQSNNTHFYTQQSDRFIILHESPETKQLSPSFSNIIAVNLYSCIRAVETALKRFTKAIGWKVSQHVVPAAVIGHAPLSSLPSDSKEPCSLTWVVPTFTALFQASCTPPFCFLWKKRKSCCLQLFPAL